MRVLIAASLVICCLTMAILAVAKGLCLQKLMRDRDLLAIECSRRPKTAGVSESAASSPIEQVKVDPKASRESRVRALIAEVKMTSPDQPSREERALEGFIGNPRPELMGDPEYDRQVMALARHAAQRDLEYYVRLGLPADIVDAVEQKLTERFMATYDRTAVLHQSGLTDADRKFGRPMEFREEATINAEIKALTGVDAGAVSRALGDSYLQSGTQFAGLVQARLSYSGEPLNGDQAARMAELIKAEYHAQDGGSDDAAKRSMKIAGGRLAVLSPTFFKQLGEFMSPAQIQVLREVQAERVAAKRISELKKASKNK